MKSSDTPTIPDGAELLTLREVARLCGVSDRTVWGWAESGMSPRPLKLSRGCVRYSKTAYLRWIAAGCPRVDGEGGRHDNSNL